MNFIFTVCSNNYLAQAMVLYKSIKRHSAESQFVLFLCDKKRMEINYGQMADVVIEIAEIEADILNLARKYDVIELNTAVKPTAAQYLFEELGAEKIIYLDPDIKIYSSLEEIFKTLNEYSIILSPHICTPIQIDGKRPSENTFLNYGIYNLGFLGIRKDQEVSDMLSWWKNNTYGAGYNDVVNGVFVDQLPMNHVPIFFKQVHVSKDMGINMAPWNLHERVLTKNEKNEYLVNRLKKLVFYHFSAINIDEIDLSLANYGRFFLPERGDLLDIYQEYHQELIDNQYHFFRNFSPFYLKERDLESNKITPKRKWYEKILFKRQTL